MNQKPHIGKTTENKERIYIFDLDNTLIDTQAKVRVYDEVKGISFELGSTEYNEFQKNPRPHLYNIRYNFIEFDSVTQLISEPKLPLFDHFKTLVNTDPSKVYIITNRSNQGIIYDWCWLNGVAMRRGNIFCAPTDMGTRSKGDILRGIMKKTSAPEAWVYEDDRECLRSMLEVPGARLGRYMESMTV